MITFHAFNGVIALAAGLAIILLHKGTRTHKIAGRIYAGSMYILCLASSAIQDTTPFFRGLGIFHVAALVSLGTLTAGLVPALYRKGFKDWYGMHYYFMLWSYVGLIMALNSHFFRNVFLFIADLGLAKPASAAISILILWVFPPVIGSLLINRKAPGFRQKFSPGEADAAS